MHLCIDIPEHYVLTQKESRKVDKNNNDKRKEVPNFLKWLIAKEKERCFIFNFHANDDIIIKISAVLHCLM